jgi:hypothetical protein
MTNDDTAPGVESEQVFTTAQVAASLKLGPAMIRKYALALEGLTGKRIPLRGREGRQFSPENFNVISKAKALVDSNNGLSVDTALKMVLSGPENAADTLAAGRPSGNTTELAEALTAAIAKGNEPLLAELRELRLELRETRESNTLPAEIKNLAPVEVVAPAEADRQHGLLVRLAMKLESWVRK